MGAVGWSLLWMRRRCLGGVEKKKWLLAMSLTMMAEA